MKRDSKSGCGNHHALYSTSTKKEKEGKQDTSISDDLRSRGGIRVGGEFLLSKEKEVLEKHHPEG